MASILVSPSVVEDFDEKSYRQSMEKIAQGVLNGSRKFIFDRSGHILGRLQGEAMACHSREDWYGHLFCWLELLENLVKLECLQPTGKVELCAPGSRWENTFLELISQHHNLEVWVAEALLPPTRLATCRICKSP